MLLVQRLDQRRQAVGGARGVGDHRVRALERLVVDAEDDVASTSLPPGAEMITFFAPPFRCAPAFLLGREEAGALEHHVDAEAPTAAAPGRAGRAP